MESSSVELLQIQKSSSDVFVSRSKIEPCEEIRGVTPSNPGAEMSNGSNREHERCAQPASGSGDDRVPSFISPSDSPKNNSLSKNPPMTSTPVCDSRLVSGSKSQPSVSIVTPNNSQNMPLSPITSSDDNAITIIHVQPGTSSSNAELVDRKSEAASGDNGDGITRINVVTGRDVPDSANKTVSSQHSPVKVSVLNGDHCESENRPLRLNQNNDGTSLHQDDIIVNDAASEISSVVNNPSVISQIPDRYGFMGGDQYTHESEPDPSPEIVRRREMKWLHMMDRWHHFMRKEFKTVRSRCRKGIPRSVRGRAWYYLSGASYIKEKQPDLFQKLLEQEGDPQSIEDIKKDLHRQFPWHEIFAEEGHGQKDLFNVLKAHSILNSKDGYCQAQAPIAAILLMHMPAEDAFWCLVAICDKYLKGYYSPGMEQVQLDGDILFGLLKRVAPPVYKHMKKQSIDPVLYMTEWFLCAYTRTLPWPSVLRIWDSFLCEGVKVLFRVGLVLLKYTLGRPGVLKQCPQMYDTLQMLKNLPNYVTHEQFLVVQIQRLDISDDQMRREHYKQVVKRKKKQQKLEAAKKQEQKVNSKKKTPKQHETAL